MEAKCQIVLIGKEGGAADRTREYLDDGFTYTRASSLEEARKFVSDSDSSCLILDASFDDEHLQTRFLDSSVPVHLLFVLNDHGGCSILKRQRKGWKRTTVSTESYMDAIVLIGSELRSSYAEDLAAGLRSQLMQREEVLHRINREIALAIGEPENEGADGKPDGDLDNEFLQRLPVSLMLINEEMEIVKANHRPSTKPAKSDENLVGKQVGEVLSPIISPEGDLLKKISEVQGTSNSVVLKSVRYFNPQGNEESWNIRMTGLPEIGKGRHVLIEILDVTGEKKPGDGVLDLRGFSEDVLQSISSGLVVCDTMGEVVMANDAASGILGSDERHILHMTIKDILGEEVAEEILSGTFFETNKERNSLENTLITPDGREIAIGYNVVHLSDSKGRIVGLIINFKDISEIKVLKQRMMRNDKMAAVGTLAGGVAHEFNNLIGGMLGYAQLAKATGSVADYEKSVDVVFESTRRAKDIISSLLTFARRPENIIEKITVDQMIDQVLILVERDLTKNNIEVVRDYQFKDNVQLDVGALQQTLLSLITNSKQAMYPNGGRMTISTRIDSGMLNIEVKDEGKGIPEKDLEKIFDPFYTTKGSLGGSQIPGDGLGLSICYNLVTTMEGEIQVSSKEGEGSVFSIVVPFKKKLTTEEPTNLEEVTNGDLKKSTAYAEGRSALVVSLTTEGRLTVSRNLRRYGYSVSTANDLASAGEKLSWENYDLLIIEHTDDLEDILEALLENLQADESIPDVVVLVDPGIGFAFNQDRIPDKVCIHVMEKPFDPHNFMSLKEDQPGKNSNGQLLQGEEQLL